MFFPRLPRLSAGFLHTSYLDNFNILCYNISTRARISARLYVMEPVEQEKTSTITNRPYSEADFDGYRAAPLLIIGGHAKPELIANQDRLMHQFGEVTEQELIGFVKPDVVSFVSDAITTRMQQREGLNGTEYLRRLHKIPHLFCVPDAGPLEVYEACRNALYGRGSVLQNDMARRAFGMASAEYANLTIVGEFRRNLEVPMWADISELIDEDATPKYEQMKNLQVIGFEQSLASRSHATPQHIRAMRIGMKRDIGVLDDGTVLKGRTTAIINTRPSSGFNQDDVVEIYEAHQEKADMRTIEALCRVARRLVDEVIEPGVVLGRNETVYGFNEAMNERITARDTHRWAQGRTFGRR